MIKGMSDDVSECAEKVTISGLHDLLRDLTNESFHSVGEQAVKLYHVSRLRCNR